MVLPLDEGLLGLVDVQDLLGGECCVGNKREQAIAACIVVEPVLTKHPGELEARLESATPSRLGARTPALLLVVSGLVEGEHLVVQPAIRTALREHLLPR